MTATGLDLYDIAYLAGGPDRVVDTAVVALVEAGRLTVPVPGQLAATDPTRRHPVEAAVLDAVGTRGHRSVDTVVFRLAGDDRIADIGRRLRAEGLLSRRPALGRRDGRPPARTAAGRRLLRALVAEPPVFSVHDGGCAVQVALRDRVGIADESLRRSIFEPVPVPTPKERAAGLRRRLDEGRIDPILGSRNVGMGAGGGGGGDVG